MVNKFLTGFLSFFLFISVNLTTAPKAEAAIGLIVKNRTAKTVGGIGAASSAVVFGGGLLLAEAGVVTFNIASAVLFVTGTMFFGALGLITLDGETIADVEFMPIKKTTQSDGLTMDEVRMYNSELDELNAIRKSVQTELAEDDSSEDAKELWNAYKGQLHPYTVKVAELKALELAKKFKVKK